MNFTNDERNSFLDVLDEQAQVREACSRFHEVSEPKFRKVQDNYFALCQTIRVGRYKTDVRHHSKGFKHIHRIELTDIVVEDADYSNFIVLGRVRYERCYVPARENFQLIIGQPCTWMLRHLHSADCRLNFSALNIPISEHIRVLFSKLQVSVEKLLSCFLVEVVDFQVAKQQQLV